MQYALVNNKKKKAEPNLKGTCRHCRGAVHSKCGEINIWHWAHISIENCDSWHEPETQWHLDWKDRFGEEFSEISIIQGDERHIADVKTKNGIVIEFQNSAITPDTIKERELFYGGKMIWVINGEHFKENFRFWDNEYLDEWIIHINEEKDFPKREVFPERRALVVYSSGIKRSEVKEILLKHKFVYLEEKDAYWRDLSGLVYVNYMTWEMDVYREIMEVYKEKQRVERLKKIKYEWSWARKVWRDSIRPIFIDLNTNELIWIKSGLGQKSGEGIRVSKQEFLEKYRS